MDWKICVAVMYHAALSCTGLVPAPRLLALSRMATATLGGHSVGGVLRPDGSRPVVRQVPLDGRVYLRPGKMFPATASGFVSMMPISSESFSASWFRLLKCAVCFVHWRRGLRSSVNFSLFPFVSLALFATANSRNDASNLVSRSITSVGFARTPGARQG